MLRLMKKLARRQSATKLRRSFGSRSRPRATLGLEALEDRQLLSTAPIILTTIQEAGNFGNTIATATAIPVQPMLETQVQGQLSGSSNVDMFAMSLTQGQILTADVSSTSGLLFLGKPMPLHLSLFNGQGSLQPASLAGAGQDLEFRIAQTGTYYLQLASTATSSTQTTSYSLNVLPIGLNTASLSPSLMASTNGGLYAWLNGHVLDISGPVGHGFGIRGNWTKSVSSASGLPAATYTATGTIYLQTPRGEVAMPLPTGTPMTVSTGPRLWGNVFGAISSVSWSPPSSVAAFAAVLGVLDPSAFLGLGNVVQSIKVGINLGNDPTLQNTGAPLNPAFPYIYLSVNPLAGTVVGQVTQAFSVVLDPADPFMFIGSPMTSSSFPITAIAVSQNGLIPYTPQDAPSQWTGSMYGNFYVQGVINTTDLTLVPSQVKGSLTLNLDPNHTGQWLGGSITPLQLANLLLLPGVPATFMNDPQTVEQVFKNFSAGFNGELDISPWDTVQNIPYLTTLMGSAATHMSDILQMSVPRFLTMGQASLIYTGPSESFFFRGGTANPFAGTVLAALAAPTTVDIDGAFHPGGEFYLDARGTYQPIGFTATSGEVRVLNHWPTVVPTFTIGPFGLPIFGTRTIYVTSVSLDLNVNVLGATVSLQGQVQGNGDFDVTGSGALGLAGLSATANFNLYYSHTGYFQFTAAAQAHYSSSVVRADLSLNFSMAVDAYGHLIYSGSGTASASVYTYFFGWRSAGTVGVGINNSEIWFTVNGIEIVIPLP
jgi:hypothetical protein